MVVSFKDSILPLELARLEESEAAAVASTASTASTTSAAEAPQPSPEPKPKSHQIPKKKVRRIVKKAKRVKSKKKG